MTYLLLRHHKSKQVISGQNVAGQESMTYPLLRHHRKQTGYQWTECCRTGIHDLPAVEASQKVNRISVDRMLQDRNPWLTVCQSITENKQEISGQNIAGQESMTYHLSKHHRKQTGDQWTECCRTGIHHLPSVKASQKANRRSVDRMLQDRNPWPTSCWSITESKQDISGQNVAGQESITYSLLRHHRKKTGGEWTECLMTGIHDLPSVKPSHKTNRWSVDRMLQDGNPWLTICQSIT